MMKGEGMIKKGQKKVEENNRRWGYEMESEKKMEKKGWKEGKEKLGKRQKEKRNKED